MIALDELLSLAKKATAGPWKSAQEYIFIQSDEKLITRIAKTFTNENQDYIAACNPETIISLINQLNEANEALKFYGDHKIYEETSNAMMNMLPNSDVDFTGATIPTVRIKNGYYVDTNNQDRIWSTRNAGKTARAYLEKYGVK